MSEENQQSLLAPKEKMILTKEQALMTGSALLASGVLDVATHFDGFCVFAGLAGAFLAYRHGNDLLDHFLPGRHNNQAIAATTRFMDVVAAQQDSTLDQSVPAKLKRLVGMKTPPVPQPKEASQSPVEKQQNAQDEPMEALQPKPRIESTNDVDILDFDADDKLEAPVFAPSGPFYFSQVLKSFTPSLNKIYLGTLPNGQMVFTEARKLCHTALTGATRGGKDHIIRMLMSQLCFAGAKVYLLDPNYTRYDLEAIDPYGRSCPEDWTPFDTWLVNEPREMTKRDRKYKAIEHYLALAFDKVEDRLEARGSGIKLGAPQFLFVNELAAIADEVPNAKMFLKKILREGAKVGVFLVSASQDYHVSTLFKEIGGGVRKCYRTALDVGSDTATQNALGLLPLKQLGKGNGSIRYDDLLSAIRFPYVDNEALYCLLGPSTYEPNARYQQEDEEELIGTLMHSEEQQEPSTDKLPAQRRRAPMSAYELHRQRIAARRVPVYATREQTSKAMVQEPRIETQDERDDRMVLEAYQNGKKSGGAINAKTNIPLNRINVSLHRLADAGKIDWQPRK